MDTPKRKYTDPLGRPLEQRSPTFTDQQAGGDLTGREPDARDGNFSSDASGQQTRDMTSAAEEVSGMSADILREQPVRSPEPPPPTSTKPVPMPVIAPDGSEDPGSSIDDGLAPTVPVKPIPRR